MKRNEIIKLLNSLEAKYPVNRWEVAGIYVWPMVKKDIFYKYFHLMNEDDEKLLNNSSYGSLFGRINRTVVSIIKYFYLRFLTQKKQIDFFFASAHHYRADIDGEFTNKFYQPLIEYLAEHHPEQRCLTIEYDLLRDKQKRYRERPNILFLKDYTYAAWIIQKLKPKYNIRKDSMEGFESFITDVNKAMYCDYNIESYKKSLERQVRLILSYSSIFDILFKKFNPKAVFGLGYYSGPMYGMYHAAKQNRILSIDMQHGGQGSLHICYQSLKKHPRNGYSLLPNIFWCWDDVSANVIKEWSRDVKYQNVIVGGNPWLSYCIDNYSKKYDFPAKKVILYTMQFNKIESFILDAIKNSPADYQWWIRLHPRKTDGRADIEAILQDEISQGKVEIVNAISYPLPIILLNSYVHISRFSGSVIEAAQLRIKTIVIDEVGAEMYGDYLKEGTIEYLERPDGDYLLKKISSTVKPEYRLSSLNKFKSIIQKFVDKNGIFD